MENPNHRELEVKIEASGVPLKSFKEWALNLTPTSYEHVIGPDTYYEQGANVLRHRHSGPDAGELTVKRRMSKKTTQDRVEIDLRFDPRTTQNDVVRFLRATGWTPVFKVVKDCHIFRYDDRNPGVEVVFYDVECYMADIRLPRPDARRFIEIEIHKAHSLSPAAVSTLRAWERSLRQEFRVGKTLNDSLYEIYSGKRYQLSKT